MNLVYEIVPSETDNSMAVTARVRAAGPEFRGVIKGLIEEAISEGARIARAEAPRSSEFHHGNRISDAIIEVPVTYHAGGAGGGGYFEGSIEARSDIAPHLRYVYEGTGIRGIEDTGLIRPTKGNVMAIQKLGEEVSFVRWTRGQFPQQRWWSHAEEHVDMAISEGVRTIEIP